MGQTYPFNKENDELLSEAEKAFDLSARREAMLKMCGRLQKHHPADAS
jgi:hypothetical protein